MFKRIPDERLTNVTGAVGKPVCKCICVEYCACDSLIPGDDASSYAVMVPQSTTSTSSTNFKNSHRP